MFVFFLSCTVITISDIHQVCIYYYTVCGDAVHAHLLVGLESVLFTGTQFSNLYTGGDAPARAA